MIIYIIIYIELIEEVIMVNLAFYHPFGFPLGGAEKVTSNLAKPLTNKGYRVTVFTKKCHEYLLTEDDKKYIQVVEVDTSDQHAILLDRLSYYHIDVLVLTSRFPHYRKLLEKCPCQVVFALHNIPLWQKNNVKTECFDYLKNKQYTVKNKIIEIKNCYKKYKKVKNKGIDFFKCIYNYTDAFVVLCDAYRLTIERIIGQKDNNKIVTISNGVPPIKQAYNLEKKKQLLYVGRITKYDKRPDRLLYIWKELYRTFTDWELIFVGGGVYLDELKSLAQSLNLERVTFCGEKRQVEPYYNDAAILCMTSQYESFPMVLLEAQQVGVVPIAFNCSPGVAHILSDSGNCGVLVKKYNMKKYKQQLERLMCDEFYRKKLQQNCLENVKQYDLENIVDQWDDLFKSVLSK